VTERLWHLPSIRVLSDREVLTLGLSIRKQPLRTGSGPTQHPPTGRRRSSRSTSTPSSGRSPCTEAPPSTPFTTSPIRACTTPARWSSPPRPGRGWGRRARPERRGCEWCGWGRFRAGAAPTRRCRRRPGRAPSAGRGMLSRAGTGPQRLFTDDAYRTPRALPPGSEDRSGAREFSR
jgi:hypothetical protein